MRKCLLLIYDFVEEELSLFHIQDSVAIYCLGNQGLANISTTYGELVHPLSEHRCCSSIMALHMELTLAVGAY